MLDIIIRQLDAVVWNEKYSGKEYSKEELIEIIQRTLKDLMKVKGVY